MKINIKTISEETGFSPATVSNALNHKRGVNPKTSEIILRKAAELGYFTENRHSKVKFIIFKKTGKIVDDTPFFPALIAGVEDECRLQGLEMVLCNLDLRRPDYQEQIAKLQSDQTCLNILLGTEIMEEDAGVISGFVSPIVVIDYWNDEMSFTGIQINNEDAVQTAISHLLKMGHRRIGYLAGNIRIHPFEMRKRGFFRSMDAAGIPVLDRDVLLLGTTMDTAYADMKQYLSEGPELASAYFADNDMIALGAVRALSDSGLRVPDDVSVIGFDDLPFSAVSFPPLTTLRVPKDEIGREAVLALLQISRTDMTAKLKIQVCPVFIERDSVRCLCKE